MTRTSMASILVLLGLVACSESNDGGSGTGTGGAGATGGTSGSGGNSGGSGGASGGASGGSPSGGTAGTATGGAAGGGFESCGLTVNTASAVVVNEISSDGDDWLELVNTGSSAIDLGDMVIADFDAATGCPKTTEALTFPTGAMLQSGEHLLIVADQAGAPNTPQTNCLGATTCYYAGFGISASSGDVVFLLDGTSIEANGDIPAGAAAAGTSWCRKPDSIGEFSNCATPTPGAAND